MAAPSDRQDARWSRRDALAVAGAGLAAAAVATTSAVAQGKLAKEVANLACPGRSSMATPRQ
jgi:F0F1-type ATP synthase membrane subunit c/vacuolar-type H+-ATPase subunit K